MAGVWRGPAVMTGRDVLSTQKWACSAECRSGGVRVVAGRLAGTASGGDYAARPGVVRSAAVSPRSCGIGKRIRAHSESPMSDPKPPGWLPPGAMRLAGAGVELAAGLGACCLLGYWIDRRFDTSPWGLLICAVIGVIGGLYNLVRRAVHEMVQRPGGRKGGKTPPSDGAA